MASQPIDDGIDLDYVPDRVARFAYPIGIVVIWIAYFSRALIGGQTFFCRDLFFMHEPLRRYWTSLASSGHAPYLNSALNLGEPILANPINALCYPGNLLYLLLPFGTAWNLALAGHVLWAALGSYWLARRLDCTRPAAFCGALVFGFCGPLVSSLNYYNLLVAASWIPWAAGCALMAWRRGGLWAVATALALAMQIVSGEPTIVVLTAGLLGCGYAVGLIRDRSRYRAVLAQGLLIAVVAALLASIQILPTLSWLSHSGRSAGLPFRESAAYWSLHPARLAEFLVPHVYGNPSARLASEFWGGRYSDSGLPLIMKLYAGWIPLLLLPLALRRSLGRWAAFIFASSILLSFGHRLVGYHFLFKVFAPLRMVRYPEKFTILSALALALATSLALPKDGEGGIDDARGTTRTRVLLLTALGVLIALLPILAYVFTHGALTPDQRTAQLAAIGQAAIVGVVSALVLLLGTFPRYRRIATGLIPAVLVLDLASVTLDIAGTRPRAELDAAPALLAQLANAPSMPILHLGEQQGDAYFLGGRDPFSSMQDALHPFTALRWGVVYGAVDDIDRMGWNVAAERQRFLHRTLFAASHPGGDGHESTSAALAIMGACGIGRVVSLAPLTIVGLHEESHLELPSGPTVRVYATDAAPGALARFESGSGTLTFKDEAPHRISLSVDSTAESKIVVARNALDGWSANCDGRAIAMSASGEGLLRLSVPAGAHHLLLAYTPPGLPAGAVLSAAGLAALMGWIWVARRRSQAPFDRR